MRSGSLVLVALLLFASWAAAAPRRVVSHRVPPRADALVGAWELAGPPVGDGQREVKLITPTRFTWTTWDTTSHEILASGGGHYERHGDVFFERLEFAHGNTSSIVGQLLVFRAEVHGDTLVQRGVPGSVLPDLYEVWVRTR